MLDTLAIARETIAIERAGLQLLSDGLDLSFAEAVEILLAVKGRVILTGMGKSGHIATKIAATMASVGTPAHFVHPAEASHGDLGMINPEDVVIAVSNSGETTELSDVLLYCNRFGIKLIAITSRAASTLSERADICLLLPAAEEACPLQKAPTTSTTMTLALGDALAMCLLKSRGFTKEDFGKFHPGGKLGAQLMTVEQVWKAKEAPVLPLADQKTPLREVMVAMSGGIKGCVGVVNTAGALVGMATDGDLRRHFQVSDDINTSVENIMSHDPITLKPSALAADALSLMQRNRITAIFMVDEKHHPKGVIHIQELLQFGVV